MLSIQHLSKTYPGGKKAVDDLSLEIQAGDIYGFIGHNGAGKTTTIKCVVGIHDFEQGEILVDGVSIKKDPIRCKKTFAYLPDNPDLYEYLTGIQFLNFIADIYAVPKGQRQQAIAREADAFGMTAALGDPISAYSHGMKQKLALIGALIHAPRLLVLDEPFVGLDPSAALLLKTRMGQLCAQGGAIFFSTHVLDVAEKLCNKVAIIKDGALVAQGDTQSLTGGASLESVFMEVVGNGQAAVADENPTP